jgi:uncharacterized protein (TIGR01244 family)
VNDTRITGGQPTEDQLRDAANEGFSAVINLAPHSSRNALPDEAGLVQSLGMTYHYIPVDWNTPTPADFEAFEAALNQHTDDKTIIHCAANFRASAFYMLYAMKNLGWTDEEAEAFRAPIWEGSQYPLWEDFIEEMKEKISQ